MLCQGIENGVAEYSVVIVTEYSVTPIQSPYYNLATRLRSVQDLAKNFKKFKGV